MKKLNTILLSFALAFTSFTSFGQSQLKIAKDRVGGDIDIAYNWKVGEVKETNGVKVLRTEGENGIDHRTNVFYIPQEVLLARIGEKAAVEPVYNRDQEQLVNFYTTEFPGGQVAIFFDRIEKDLADPRNFTIVVVDPKTNSEIYRTKLEYQQPYAYKFGIYYYYTVVNIPSAVGEKFIVRVVDEGLQQSSEFVVYDNYPSKQPPSSVVSAEK